MPYRQVYEEAPKNPKLPVLEKLPDGVHQSGLTWGTKEAYGNHQHFYYCPHCKGWIEGHANEYQVNNLDSAHLAGRQGTEWYCLRCGNEIAFIGIMS